MAFLFIKTPQVILHRLPFVITFFFCCKRGHEKLSLTFFFTVTGSSLVSNSFLFFLSGLSSSLARGTLSRDSRGGRFFGGSSSLLLETTSRSAFLFTADVAVSALTGVGASVGGSGSSFGSRIKRGSLRSEPGRFDAYLNPGPLFCFVAKSLEKQRGQLYFSGSGTLH